VDLRRDLGSGPTRFMGHAYLIPFKNNRQRHHRGQLVVGLQSLMILCASVRAHHVNLSQIIHYSDD